MIVIIKTYFIWVINHVTRIQYALDADWFTHIKFWILKENKKQKKKSSNSSLLF